MQLVIGKENLSRLSSIAYRLQECSQNEKIKLLVELIQNHRDFRIGGYLHSKYIHICFSKYQNNYFLIVLDYNDIEF